MLKEPHTHTHHNIYIATCSTNGITMNISNIISFRAQSGYRSPALHIVNVNAQHNKNYSTIETTNSKNILMH
jgi:hypothetical protein